MKKVLTVLISALCLTISSAYAEELEYDNPGFYETLGMVGAYGLIPDYTTKNHSYNGIGGGGGFVYYNVINKIGGNFAIGLSADYSNVGFNDGVFRAKIDSTPLALNFAYMTASDFLNVWAGLAFTYTFLAIDIKDGNVPGKTDGHFGKLSRKNTGVIGGDAFVGAEYIFTQNKQWGVFFEFRYSLTQDLKINEYVAEQDYNINGKMNFSKLRYTLGVTFHF